MRVFLCDLRFKLENSLILNFNTFIDRNVNLVGTFGR